MLCATFPQVPVIALTATASKADVKEIKDSLNMKNPLELIGDPNRANIFYEKVFRKGNDIDFFQEHWTKKWIYSSLRIEQICGKFRALNLL